MVLAARREILSPANRASGHAPLTSHSGVFRWPIQVSRRRHAVAGGAALAASPLLSLPAWAQAAKRGGTLVLGSTQVPRHLNGAVQSGIATAMPSTQIFASPLRFDDKWNPQPYLAESWKLGEDGKSLTLNLRKNAVFHDGQPVTSADVAFTILAIKANHPFTTMLAPVEKVDTPDAAHRGDPHELAAPGDRPGDVAGALPDPAQARLRRRPGPEEPSAQLDEPDRLRARSSWSSSSRPAHRRWSASTSSSCRASPISTRSSSDINPDASSLMLSFERGDIQMLPYISVPSDLKRLAANQNATLTAKGYEGIGALNWLAFNLTRKPLSRRRRAQGDRRRAIDKNFICKVLMGGFATPDDGPIVPSSPFAVADLVRYPVDLKKAAAMLDAAGHKAGADGERFKLTIDYLPGVDDQQKNVAEYIRGQLKKIGIGVDVRASADFPAWAKRMATHDFDMSMDIVFNWGDPVIGVARTYVSSNIKPIVWTNTQSYSNPKVDELLKEGGSELDPTKRKAYYATFEKIVTDELPIYFINVIPYHTASSKKVGQRAALDLGAAVALRRGLLRSSEPSSAWRSGDRLLNRLLLMPSALVLAVVVLNFVLVHAAPGDPVVDDRRRQRRHVAAS